MKNTPVKQYSDFDEVYDFFNHELFDGKLPICMITLNRKKGLNGYFWAGKFSNRDNGDKVDEICLNPDTFSDQNDESILATLVHEMCHLQQQHFGKPSKNGYHNKEWFQIMESVGLIGNGKGRKVSTDIASGGRFENACDLLVSSGFKINWQSVPESDIEKKIRKTKKASKTKYTCEECGLNAWAKPDVSIGCGDCGTILEPN